MSRRDGRTSINVRQQDALLEFETFKKKFLLANKHITKLNSTLSVRIEELNSTVSNLYVENLRLRASEIALAAQLKREREKSRKIMLDAEQAAYNLTKHLGLMRNTFNIQPRLEPSPIAADPQARKPIPPTTPRLSRPPTVSGIPEDEEGPSTEEEGSPIARRKSSSKPRLSASKLPLPSRMGTPPPTFPISATKLEEQSTAATRRKPSRRQSGLVTSGSARPSSPAFGSPIRRAVGLAEEADEIAVMEGLQFDVLDEEAELDAVVKAREKKARAKDKDPGETSKRRREKEDDDTLISVAEGSRSGRSRSKSEAPRTSRRSLPPLDTDTELLRGQTPDTDASTSTASHAPRSFLSTPATTPHPTTLPTPRRSSSPLDPEVAADDGAAGGRESRRTRKSVNYTEPKLNTKMRKPDSIPGLLAPAKKRASTSIPSSHSIPTSSSSPTHDDGRTPSPPPVATVKRRKSRPLLPPEQGDSEGTQADGETASKEYSDVNVDTRRKSVAAAHRGAALQLNMINYPGSH